MGSINRAPYLTSNVITQDFLDECASNLVNQLELIVDINSVIIASYERVDGTKLRIYSPAHGIIQGENAKIYLSGNPISGNEFPATDVTVDYFTVDTATAIPNESGEIAYLGYLRFSDRNKYVGSKYYEARVNFPTISRTLGELLSPSLEFSSLTIEVNNSDGKYNYLMPGGEFYGAWPGSEIVVKLGLRDVETTYRTIFSGRVTHEGGFQRSLKSFTLVARNDFDKLNVATFPVNLFNQDDYPDLESERVNFPIPIIYGDWTVEVEKDLASIPAYPVNSADIAVTGDNSTHSKNVKLVISDNDLSFFDTTQVYVKRSDKFVAFDPADIVNIGIGNKSFEIRQSGTLPGAITSFDDEIFKYKKGDEFFVKVKGKSLGAYTDNPIAQAADIFQSYGGIQVAEFDANWNTFRDKSSPAQSAISTFKSRCWIQQEGSVLEYGLQLLEQFRFEAFINNEGKIKLNSLHFEDYPLYYPFIVRNWDMEEATLRPQIDVRNNFNRVQGVFNFLPNRGENYQATKILKNQTAIDAIGTQVSKRIVYPNIYNSETATYQLKEMLRLISAYPETIDINLTWRALLLDLGTFILLDVDIGSARYVNVPCLIREIGYDPEGLKIPIKALSLQMIPFPGYNPGYVGITGGYQAIIEEE